MNKKQMKKKMFRALINHMNHNALFSNYMKEEDWTQDDWKRYADLASELIDEFHRRSVC